MSNAVASRTIPTSKVNNLDFVDVVATRLGFIAWRWQRTTDDAPWQLAQTCLGEPSQSAALASVSVNNRDRSWQQSMEPTNTPEDLADRFDSWAAGQRESFDDIPILLENASPFRQLVTDACREIGYGKTITYGQLASLVGHPGAARAVGRVMATNPLPIVVPCHRVVASGGAMRGFSATGGIDTKLRILRLEGALR